MQERLIPGGAGGLRGRGEGGAAHAARERIVHVLSDDPGQSTRQVADALGVDESTADYHLRRLMRRDRILAQRVGRELAWYLNGSGFCPVLRRALPHLRRDGVRRVALALDGAPRTAGEVALRAQVRVGEVRWAAQVLEGTGLVRRTANGRLMLREGANLCVEKGCARAPCPLWGRCLVSRSEWMRQQQGS